MTFEATIAAISGTLVGLATLAGGLYQRIKVRSVGNWPQVVGTIKKAEVIRDDGSDSSGYFVSILYEYFVDGVSYQGTRVGFRQRAYVRKKNADAVVDRYRPNTTTSVFYNPEKPPEAVLVREYPDNVLLIVSGVGFLILTIVILLYGR
jgi:hypothetical protein